MAYPNGQLPSSALTQVEGMFLAKGTARAYIRLCAAAKKAGHSIFIYGPAGAYRDLKVQREIRLPQFAKKYNVNSGTGWTFAAVGESNHGEGRAADIGPDSARTWLRAHGHEFGFAFPIARDPNHALHDGKTATQVTTDRADANRRVRHHWKALLGRKPSIVTVARFAPAIMRDVDAGTHKLRVYIKGTAAYRRRIKAGK